MIGLFEYVAGPPNYPMDNIIVRGLPPPPVAMQVVCVPIYTLYAAAPLNAVVKSLVFKSGSGSAHKLQTLLYSPGSSLKTNHSHARSM